MESRNEFDGFRGVVVVSQLWSHCRFDSIFSDEQIVWSKINNHGFQRSHLGCSGDGHNSNWRYFNRSFIGVSVDCIYTVPMYLAEVSPDDVRGLWCL